MSWSYSIIQPLVNFFVGVLFRGKGGPPVFTITGQTFSTPGQGLIRPPIHPEFIPNTAPAVLAVNSTPTASCLRGAAAYQLGNTSSRTITEVKQR